MTAALVKAGTIASVSTTSITPAFGQATTAGNFLFGICGSNGAGSLTTSSSGWNILNPLFLSNSGTMFFYKMNCGASETAPTFTDTGATLMSACLAEFSGLATSSASDAFTNFPQRQNVASIGPDTTSVHGTTGGLAVAGAFINGSKSQTITDTSSWGSSGTNASLCTNASTKQATHLIASYQLTSSTGTISASYTLGWAPSTGLISACGLIASFLPPAATARSTSIVISQAVNRASNF